METRRESAKAPETRPGGVAQLAIPNDTADLIAERLRILGQPTRLRLVDRLRHGEVTVQTLAHEVGAVQQNVSQHLGILRRAGIVARRKEGTRVFYGLTDPNVARLLDAALRSLRHEAEVLTQATMDAANPHDQGSLWRT